MWETCVVFHGSGAKPGTHPKTCHTCDGAGTVRMQQGFFSVQQTCPTCHGTGKEITDPCVACDGVGRTRKNKTLQVKIPAGIDDGMRIRSRDRKRVVWGKSGSVRVALGGRHIINKK